MIEKSIFKSYDVRGIYPSELDKKAAYLVGKAFIKATGAKKVLIGYDARLSGPDLFLGLANGIEAAGSEVYGIGMVPTEGLYFSVGKYDFPAGIMITASHNPKEYNGFKMLQKDGTVNVIRGKDLADVVEDEEVELKEPKTTPQDIWPDFISHMLSLVDIAAIKPLKIVVDASNGAAGLAIKKIQDKLPVTIIPLHFEPDGNFPNHSPNPLEPGASDKIREVIKKESADLGLMFDGDGDRVFLVDEQGNLVPADMTLLLLAKYFLGKNPKQAIGYNVICSKAVPTFIQQWGGVPVRTKVGFVNVREELMKHSGVMGGELSGHYCFRDTWYMDSGILAFLVLLQIISEDGRKVSEIVKEYMLFAKSAENNFSVTNKEVVVETVKEKYQDGQQDSLDGLTVEYKDWWFNLRASNTEPLLRLTIEADNEELLAEKKAELTKLIKEVK